MNLLIGSRALNYWFPACKIKPETDWDVISDSHIEGTEWHNPDFLNNRQFEKFTFESHHLDYNGHRLHVVRPEGLAIIKRSHLWRDLGFDKHITMYSHYLRYYFNPDSEVYQQRLELTKQAFPQKHPKLNVTVEEFFDDYVTKKYDHDWLHELVAHEGRPMYTKMQVDKTKAWCERDMWEKFTYEQKVNCVSEEAYVIALERFLIPQDFDYSPKVAYRKALNKICTTLCSGWFRDFAIDNYPEIHDNFNPDILSNVQLTLGD